MLRGLDHDCERTKGCLTGALCFIILPELSLLPWAGLRHLPAQGSHYRLLPGRGFGICQPGVLTRIEKRQNAQAARIHTTYYIRRANPGDPE
jgi:hypothetical protein